MTMTLDATTGREAGREGVLGSLRTRAAAFLRDEGRASASVGAVGRFVALAVAAHALIWSLGAWLIVDNLHVDTLEIVGWASDWSLVYPKHPPLATWIVKLAIGLPGPDLPAILALGQLLTAASAAYVWAIARLYAPARIAGAATIVFLCSPLASYFAIQFNHNVVVTPFSLACVFYGLRFLERRRTGDSVRLGVAAGLAMLAKYEAAIPLLCLIGLSALVPRFRDVWRDPRTALAIAVAVAVVAPHLVADWRAGAPTLGYADAARPMRTAADALESLNQFFDGLLYVALAAALSAVALRGTLGRPAAAVGVRPRLAITLAAAPFALLVALSLATTQIIRQGWLLPLTPFAAIGLALAFAPRLTIAAGAWPLIARRVAAISLLQALALAGFLLARDVSDKPVGSYAFDGSELRERIEEIWAHESRAPLSCLAARGRSVAESPLIQLDSKPRFVDLESFSFAGGGAPCAGAGGVAVVEDGSPYAAPLAALGLKGVPVAITSETNFGRRAWRFQVFVIPPALR